MGAKIWTKKLLLRRRIPWIYIPWMRFKVVSKFSRKMSMEFDWFHWLNWLIVSFISEKRQWRSLIAWYNFDECEVPLNKKSLTEIRLITIIFFGKYFFPRNLPRKIEPVKKKYLHAHDASICTYNAELDPLFLFLAHPLNIFWQSYIQ